MATGFLLEALQGSWSWCSGCEVGAVGLGVAQDVPAFSVHHLPDIISFQYSPVNGTID